jgi:hypothetical protein
MGAATGTATGGLLSQRTIVRTGVADWAGAIATAVRAQLVVVQNEPSQWRLEAPIAAIAKIVENRLVVAVVATVATIRGTSTDMTKPSRWCRRLIVSSDVFVSARQFCKDT